MHQGLFRLFFSVYCTFAFIARALQLTLILKFLASPLLCVVNKCHFIAVWSHAVLAPR